MKITTLSLIAVMAMSSAFAGGDIAPVEPTLDAPIAVSDSAFEVSANMALTSNYVWRGMTQSSKSPAIQGGIDLGYNGLYLGTWASNISWTTNDKSSLEADVYAGYAGEIVGVGYDLGYILYAYPNVSDTNNFEEAYIGLSKDFGGFAVNGKYSFGIDDAADDYEVGASTEVAGFGLSASYGDYDTVGMRYLVSLSKEIGKFEVSLAYSDFTADSGSAADEDYVIATISTSF
jgi:uncharacterized protein (TIGR02001 family)